MATYDPSKKYIWDVNDKFEINGAEFASILNTIRTVLNSPGAEQILMASKANQHIEDMMKKGVESGQIREAGTDVVAPKAVMEVNK